MTDSQWQTLLRVLAGERLDPPPVGLIVDSPWLPGWAGMSILDYLADPGRWLEANLKACCRFPELIFLPGFWAEYGMCTEPSAFGCRCIWPADEFPFPERIFDDPAAWDKLKHPNCRTDGLLPFVLKRMEHCRAEIERHGHTIRFATSRGPLNIASYLLGHTEFLTGIKTEPEAIHRVLNLVTDFIIEWLGVQAATVDSIDGVLVLDDLLGFIGPRDFAEFALPYMKRIFQSINVSVKALHNDAHGLVTARHLAEMGVNLFNFSFQHGLSEIRALAGPTVTLLGNLPPRDVLAKGSAEQVHTAVVAMRQSIDDTRRIVFSAGGGTPPGVPSENLDAFCRAVAHPTR